MATAQIKLNLNGNSQEYLNARPRLQAGLDNIALLHNAKDTIKVFNAVGMTRVTVDVNYMSGAMLRDVVNYLDEMGVLD